MVSQLVLYVAHVFPVFIGWLATVMDWIPVFQYGPDCPCFRHVVTFLPIYAVVVLGIYAISSVVYGVISFNDCADTRAELLKEVDEAKEDLKRRKVL